MEEPRPLEPTTGSTVLILPGFNGSGPTHWQTLWERTFPSFRRVEQRDWNRPVLADWLDVLEAIVTRTGDDVVLVAHSLACLLVAHWAAAKPRKIKGAFLVAPPDPAEPIFPVEAIGFAFVPLGRFPFPSVLAASSNDPYASLPFSRKCATAWGSRFADVGASGHINASSGLGDWPQGLGILSSLVRAPSDRRG
jgi:predicted alpha/beta hydrolase family esterase